MGERIKAAVAASYTEYQCRTHERELETATLFSRTEGVLERTFVCVAIRPLADLLEATVLLLLRDGVIAVIHGNEQVACMVPTDAAAMAKAITDEPLCAGMALAVIEEASSITPEIVVRLLKRSTDCPEDDEE